MTVWIAGVVTLVGAVAIALIGWWVASRHVPQAAEEVTPRVSRARLRYFVALSVALVLALIVKFAAIPVPEPGRTREVTLPRGEVPDAITPPRGCRFHPRCPVALPTCGWEGRDFIEFLEREQLVESPGASDPNIGDVGEWKVHGFVARRSVDAGTNERVADAVHSLLQRAPPAFAHAIASVSVQDRDVIVRFRAPDPLVAKEVEGRTVECLLY